jgi:hypothetical protein
MARRSANAASAATEERVVFRKQDNLGANDAEEDGQFLANCFVDTGDLALLRDCERPERIVLGRTGTGKTALLLKLREAEQRSVEIKPQNLALAYISNSSILRFFEDLGVNLEIFYKLIWRHAFCVELLRMRFNMVAGQEKVSLIEKVKAFFKGGQYQSAIDYLEKWGDKFWQETEHRIKEITTKVEESLKGSLKGEFAQLGLSSEGIRTLSEEKKAELVKRGQSVVNEAHVPQLNQLLDLVREVLDDPQKHYFLVIDQLDQSWVDDHLRYKLIMALIETVKDFRQIKRAKIVLSLRLDLLLRVFARARTPGFQEEKFHSLYLQMKWPTGRLAELVNARINHLFRDRYSVRRKLTHEDILVAARKAEPPLSYMLSRTFMRPRDVIAFFNECIRCAEGEPRIRFKDIKAAEPAYSRARLQSVADEWFVDYPNLNIFARTLLGGVTTPCHASKLLTDERLTSKCVELTTVSPALPPDDLLRSAERVAHEERPPLECMGAALSVFHRVGIVGLKMSAAEGHSWYADTGRRIDPGELAVETSVEVHPMFWSALQVAART